MSESLDDLKRLLAEQEATLGEEHPKVANTLCTLADVLCMKKAFDEAEQTYWRVVEIRHKHGGQRNLDVAAALEDLGSFYILQQAWSDAERLLRWCSDIKRELLGALSPEFLSTMALLKGVLQKQGKADDTMEGLSSRQLMPFRAGVERFPWKEHNHHVQQLLKAERLKDAAAYIAVLRDTADCFGANTVHQARILQLQAKVFYRLNQLDLAKTACENSLAILEREFGTNHVETMQCLVTMATVHIARNEPGEARFLLQWAHAIAVTLEGEQSERATRIEQKLGTLPGLQFEDEPIDGSFLFGGPLEPDAAVSAEETRQEEPAAVEFDLDPASEPVVETNNREHGFAADSQTHPASHGRKISHDGAIADFKFDGSPVTEDSAREEEIFAAFAQLSSLAPERHEPRSAATPVLESQPGAASSSGGVDPSEFMRELEDVKVPPVAPEAGDRADDLFSQMMAMEQLEKNARNRAEAEPAAKPSKPEVPERQDAPAPSVVSIPKPPGLPDPPLRFGSAKPAFSKPGKPIESTTKSQFGSAFGLRPGATDPAAERKTAPAGPNMDEFDDNLSTFLWEKYIKGGKLAMSQRNYVEAERMFSVALEKANAFQDERLWKTLAHLGRAHQVQKRHVRAESCFIQAQTLCEKRLGPEHADNIDYLKHLGELYLEQENTALAEPCLSRVLHLMSKSGRPDHEQQEVQELLKKCNAKIG
ncbi:MAG: tetratricopeptide repeat protein [Candidatus Obscuribacterales bacterium]|nr:tetratricopeptide repeat protein [Candidatus Obscuribacterales bacterium]